MKTKLDSAFAIRPSAVTAFGTAVAVALTLFTTTTRAPAQTNWGNALSLDGVDDYVALPNAVWFNGDFTLEAWVYPRTFNHYSRVFDFGNGAGVDEVLLAMSAGTTGRPYFSVIPGQDVRITAPEAIPTNQWTHLAITLATNTATLYVNGVPVASGIVPLPTSATRTKNYVGRSNWDTDSYANAEFDELRVWNVARTATQIQACLGGPLRGNEAGLIAYYPCNETTGAIAHDATANHFDGTLVNGPVWTNSTIPPFLNINAGLPRVCYSSSAWGDYDNDGRLDILLAGLDSTSRLIAQVWRNTGSGFTNINAGLPGVMDGSVAWGDYDNDGRLDILLTGNTSSASIAQVWRNTGSGFVNINAGLPGVYWNSAACWGDYDNDGRLDILLAGLMDSSGINRIAQVWRNTGSGFTNINAGLPGVEQGSAVWGDYDNDGRLDILLTGLTGLNEIVQVWRNTASGFTNINAGLPGVFAGSAAWGDYDNDGRLDFLFTGFDRYNTFFAQVWRNVGSTPNTLPAPPSDLAVALAGSAVNFSWNPASDAETPAAGLTYNLRVGTTPGGSDIVSPQASAAGGRRLPALGNVQQRLSFPPAFSGTGPFYWSVQAVDTAFAGSPFAPEKSFTVGLALGPESGVVPGDTNGDGIVSQAELDLVLSNYFPYCAWLSLTNTEGLGGTNVTFALPNSPAGAFSVLMSTNLTDWDYLGPATLRYEFTDTNAPAVPQRYYRLRWP